MNPFIGAVTQSKVRHSGSQGKTFPGAATPYGLVQLSPDSVTGGDNGSGYNFEHTTLQGFSFKPLFDQVQIQIDPVYGAGKTFRIVARGNAPGPRYSQSAKLNGRPLDRCWLDHKEIVAGGVLELELGAEPNKAWGNATH